MNVNVPMQQKLVVEISKIAPQFRGRSRTVEHIVEMPKVITETRNSLKKVDQVGMPEPGAQEDIVNDDTAVLQERLQNNPNEQIIDGPMPMVEKAIFDVGAGVLQECIQNRTNEQNVDGPIPVVRKVIVNVTAAVPREYIQNCTNEQIVDGPVLMVDDVTDNVPSMCAFIHGLITAILESVA